MAPHPPGSFFLTCSGLSPSSWTPHVSLGASRCDIIRAAGVVPWPQEQGADADAEHGRHLDQELVLMMFGPTVPSVEAPEM